MFRELIKLTTKNTHNKWNEASSYFFLKAEDQHLCFKVELKRKEKKECHVHGSRQCSPEACEPGHVLLCSFHIAMSYKAPGPSRRQRRPRKYAMMKEARAV